MSEILSESAAHENAARQPSAPTSVQMLHSLSVDQVLESAPDAMLIIGKGGEIVYLNSLSAKLFGYERSELLGQSIELLVPHEARGLHAAHRADYFQQPRVRRMGSGLILYGLKQDGSRFPIEISLSPLKTAAGTLVLGAVRDRTREQQTAEEIEALNRNLETKVRELNVTNLQLEEFTYTTAHDLRAPVRHILSYAQMVCESAAERLDEEEAGRLARITSAARRLGSQIDGLLEFSRIGRDTMKADRISLQGVIGEILQGFESVLGERQVTWKVGALPEIAGDGGMLRVLFTNLIENALKFTRTRRNAEIEVGCESTDDADVVFVRDNGVGFDPEFAGKLFQIFQRLHSSEDYEGTGIGLATVRRIAERHGGRVWAEGVADRGATIFVQLPRGGPGHGE